MEWYEVAFGELYPVVYGHRDAAEAARTVEAFGELLSGREPVLDLACGVGRHLEALAAAGVAAYGMDLSAFLLDRARGGALEGRLVRGDMRHLPFRSRSFGSVINMFTSFGYFEGDVDNLAVLRETARVLRDGGAFLLDFVNARRVIGGPLAETERVEEGLTIEERRSFEDAHRVLVKHVRVKDDVGKVRADYRERLRLYTAEELLTLARAAGFGVAGMFGDYGRGGFVPWESERVILLCEKAAKE